MSKFDPKKYTIKLHGKEYLEVKFRLHWFRSEKPLWGIKTEIVKLDLERGIVIIRADIYDEQGNHRSSGMKMEFQKNFQDYCEKAETGSIGRALASLGYGTLQCFDLEEGIEEGRISDSPVSNPQKGNGKPSQGQINYLKDLAKKLGLNETDFTGLSKTGVSELIETYKQQLSVKN